ncbi:MAG: tetratricopeptide repeat protein [Paludibacteraceae bacterium]|nr:tetratricopeptide repeat protein [Paludibacteraceae bacterium]
MQKIGIFILFLLCSMGAWAQNEVKANEWFQAADYAAAKKEYGLLLRRHPSSALFAYRYARCAQELGDYTTALEYFAKSGNRYDLKHFHLGEIYLKLGHAEQAIASYETYLSTLKPDSERGAYVRTQIYKAEKLQRYLRRVEKVEIIDSVETSVDSILAYCPLSVEAGTMTYTPKRNIVYTNQRQDRTLWATTHDSTSIIVSSHNLMGQWSSPDTLPSIVNFTKQQGYPYVLSDGVTLYFAACDTSGLGGYDIYVTRYNMHTESYTTPENVGMPFNSTANDYMMLIDEHRNIGYFATDRFSANGKVRIYSFVPTVQKNYWRGLSQDSLVAYAQLRYVWPVQQPNEITKRDSIINPSPTEAVIEKEIFFILNDSVVYTSLTDFRNINAQKKYQEWAEIQLQIQNNAQQLATLREQYSQADDEARKKMAPAILQLEQLQSQYATQCDQLINKSRELETSAHQQ